MVAIFTHRFTDQKVFPPNVHASDTVKGGKPPFEFGTPTKANVPRCCGSEPAAKPPDV